MCGLLRLEELEDKMNDYQISALETQRSCCSCPLYSIFTAKPPKKTYGRSDYEDSDLEGSSRRHKVISITYAFLTELYTCHLYVQATFLKKLPFLLFIARTRITFRNVLLTEKVDFQVV